MTFRVEEDSLGQMDLPVDCMWGIHTARAIGNFPISNIPLSLFPEFVRSLAWVKKAAAKANRSLGVLTDDKAEVISAVCDEITKVRPSVQAPLDQGFSPVRAPFQSGLRAPSRQGGG